MLQIQITITWNTFCLFPLLANSIPFNFTGKFFTCKFHRTTFTAKFHCLQIPTIRLYRQSPLQIPRQPIYCQNRLLADSITCKFTQPAIPRQLADFQNSFTVAFSRKFAALKWSLNIPPHLNRVATLPCKILISEISEIYHNYNLSLHKIEI